MATAVETLIAHALTFVGYREGPDNDTPFGRRTGYPNQPWCDSWVSCVAADVGLTAVIPMSASVPDRLTAARKAGQVTTAVPRRGDLACFDWNRDGVPDHIGIVLDVGTGVIHTVEGNTQPGDSGNQGAGDGVYRRTRQESLVEAYIRPPYPTGEWDMPTVDDIVHALWTTPVPTGEVGSDGHPLTMEWMLVRAYQDADKVDGVVRALASLQPQVQSVMQLAADLQQRVAALGSAVEALAHGSPVTLAADQIAALAAAVADHLPAGGASPEDIAAAVRDRFRQQPLS